MGLSTNEALDAVLITRQERKALTALLYSGMTGGVLDRMGLEDLCKRLSGCYNGPWQFEAGKDKVPTLDTYGVPVKGNIIEVSP